MKRQKYVSRNKYSTNCTNKSSLIQNANSYVLATHDSFIAQKLGLLRCKIEEKYQQSIINQLYKFPRYIVVPRDVEQSYTPEIANVYTLSLKKQQESRNNASQHQRSHTRNISFTGNHKIVYGLDISKDHNEERSTEQKQPIKFTRLRRLLSKFINIKELKIKSHQNISFFQEVKLFRPIA